MRNISKIENLNTYIECEKKQNIYLEFFQYHAEEKNYMTDQSDHFNQNYFSLRKKRKQKKNANGIASSPNNSTSFSSR